MPNFDYLTTSELAALRGVTRQAILAAVKTGRIEPAEQLPNGMYLFAAETALDETP